MYTTRLYKMLDGKAVSAFQFLEDFVTKSAESKLHNLDIKVVAYKDRNTYMEYTFSLNEMEAEFTSEDSQLASLTFRDTSVNKKIEFVGIKGILTYVKGQDTVGRHSETNWDTVKQPIYSISINEKEYQHPFNMIDIYNDITGASTNDTPKWWDTLSKISTDI